MKELCSHTPTVEVKAEEREVIDLSFDGDEPAAGPSKESMQPPLVPMSAVPPDYHAFAEDDSRAELRELLDCLKRDELQKMVKDMNLKSKGHTVRYVRSHADMQLTEMLRSTEGSIYQYLNNRYEYTKHALPPAYQGEGERQNAGTFQADDD